MTGFTLILDARKSLVILYSSLNVSIQVSICMAMVNLLEICIFSVSSALILPETGCNVNYYIYFFQKIYRLFFSEKAAFFMFHILQVFFAVLHSLLNESSDPACC